jgi:hypothetical protein
VRGAEGTSGEWRRETVRRYQRRTTRVDEAILGVYLAGGNTRRKGLWPRCCEGDMEHHLDRHDPPSRQESKKSPSASGTPLRPLRPL